MRRFLHSAPEAPLLAGRNVVQAASLDPRVPQTPKFSVLGLGSMLQVQLPPSVELVAKRNSLTGILGVDAPAASIASRLRVARSPLLSWWARQPVLQQRVVGTSPLTCLISPTKNEFLSTIELDGTIDWAVKAPIQAFTGRQLHISQRSGWSPGSAPFAHAIVSGRGLVCVGSPSSTVRLDVAEEESVLVAKQHLVALSLDTNAQRTAPLLKNIQYSFNALESGPDLESILPKDPAALSGAGMTVYGRALQRVWSQLKEAWHGAVSQGKRVLRSGNTGAFVEISGPSTVIVSAAAKIPPVEKQRS